MHDSAVGPGSSRLACPVGGCGVCVHIAPRWLGCAQGDRDADAAVSLFPRAKQLSTLAAVALGVSGVRQQSIWASVVSDDASALQSWLLALGFVQDLLIPGEAHGQIHHCQLDWPEGGRILLSSTGERPTPCRPGTSSLHVVTADPDAVMGRVRALNASVVHELADQADYPSRDFTVADPDGNHWTFATFAG